MEPEVREKNCKELLFQRMLMAVISSIALQLILITFIALLVNIMNIITSPLSTIEATWSIFMSMKVWCYLFVAAVMISMEGIICSKNYLNPPTLYMDSRFTIFCKLFTPYNLMIGGIYIVSGVILVLVYLSLQSTELHSSNSLIQNCNTISGSCINEEYLFLLVGGFWTGFYYYIKTNVFGLGKVLQFPIIPQSKLPQISRGMRNILSSSITGATWPTIYYFIMYYCFSSYLRAFTMSILYSAKLEESLDSIWRLFNLSLIFNLLLYISLFALTINTMHFLFQVYLTEWMQFQIGPSIYTNEHNETQIITLADALAMDKVPIIQHLGYLDLSTLAQKEKYRRSVLFRLSQPGGHPYNWNCIIEKCLALVKGFADEISSPTVAPVVKKNATEDAPFERAPHKMRNLTTSKPILNSTIPEIVITQHGTSPMGLQFINEFIKTTKLNVTSYLLSKPLIFYLFGTQSDCKMQFLMINGQSIIWAVDSISSLAVASLEEDPYGIVQKDLPSIIQVLIDLKQSLDKFYKINMLTKKPQADDKQIRQMLTSLKVANKRSIYRITTGFKNYMDDLQLEQSLKDQLANFFVCKE